MLQEEIARLTGRLKFEVDNRPLLAFEKRLGGVLVMLKELSTLANKKFTVKVALDSRSLRTQIEKATKTKISLTNVDVSKEALDLQAKRIQDYLNKTTINLNNVKVDIKKLVEQKRFVRTLLGQMDIQLPIKLKLSQMESELRREVKAIGDRNPLKLKIAISHNAMVQQLTRAIRQAEKGVKALKIRVAEPQVRLKVDKQHLIDEIKAAIASHEFRIRINARDMDRAAGGGGRGGYGSGSGRSQADRGLAAAAGFARGALPGLGAAFAFSQMNDINQKVTAANNSLMAISGDEQGSTAKYDSNRNFLTNISREMGLNFRDIAPQYSSIYQAASPSIGIAGTQDMFRGIMQFGTTHGISREAMKGSLTALSQMFGKDKIQAEEARQQFAERMPNGMAMLAQAAGNAKLTNGSVAEFSDLMQSGKADPKKILPELGRLMKAASEANQAYARSLDTTRVAQGRMNVAFEESVTIFAKGGFDRGMASFFNTMADSMNRAQPLTEALGKAFEILVQPLNALIRILGAIGENWGYFADQLGVSKNALATFAAAVGIFMLPFGGFVTAIGVAALAIDDLITYMRGGDSVFGDWVKNTDGAQDSVDGISFAIDGLKAAWDDLKMAFADSENPFKDWTIDDQLKAELDTIKGIIEDLASTLRMIVKIKEGDWEGAAKEFGRGGRDAYTPPTDEKPGWWVDLPGQFKNTLASQYTRYNPNSHMPTDNNPASPPQQSPAALAPINLAPGAISLEVTCPVPEGTDPKQFADKFGPHIHELTQAAVRDVFGQARALQAER